MSETLIKELDLAAVQEPVFRLKLKVADGADPIVRDYDPFAIVEKLQDEIADSPQPGEVLNGAIAAAQDKIVLPLKKTSVFKAIRLALNLPDLSSHACLLVMLEVSNHVESLKITKDLEALNAKTKAKERAEREKDK